LVRASGEVKSDEPVDEEKIRVLLVEDNPDLSEDCESHAGAMWLSRRYGGERTGGLGTLFGRKIPDRIYGFADAGDGRV